MGMKKINKKVLLKQSIMQPCYQQTEQLQVYQDIPANEEVSYPQKER